MMRPYLKRSQWPAFRVSRIQYVCEPPVLLDVIRYFTGYFPILSDSPPALPHGNAYHPPQLLVLYFSFTFFSRQFQASQVKEAVQAMKESEADEVSQGLKPLKPGEEKVRICSADRSLSVQTN